MAGFKTKARAIDLLGQNQISDLPTAISELFKNAHDADATTAVLSVDTDSKSIILWDDGHGMDFEEVNDKWLTIGTDSKLGNGEKPVKYTESGLRVTMGEKGIGRLAISLLGSQLLMITKRQNKPWVVLFLHWGVFENGQLLLEDTHVPVLPLQSPAALSSTLATMKEELRKSLETTVPRVMKAWKAEARLKETILQEIDAFHLSHRELPGLLREMERAGHGTLFLIRGLKENWSLLGSAEGKRSARTRRKLSSLELMLSNFSSIMRFEQETQPVDSFPFEPLIEIDGKLLTTDIRFEPEDLNRYDYGIEGRVERGTFHGRFLLQGSEPCEVTLPLTQGIDISESKDCGPYGIRLYFVEGMEKNSYLPPGVHEIITRKLDVIGGLYMYRDGLRVLPYGSPDFDFLELEKTRSKNTGRFPLSLRRIFGYISISKVHNPGLQDKSNREGLRVNAEYEFFLAVLKNLIHTWVGEFINPFRKEVVAENKRQAQARREEQELIAQREREVQDYLRALRKEIERRRIEYEQAVHALGEKIAAIPDVDSVSTLTVRRATAATCMDVLMMLRHLQRHVADLHREVDALGNNRPVIPARFSAVPEVADLVENWTYQMQAVQADLRARIEARYNESRHYLRQAFDTYLNRLTEELRLSIAGSDFLAKLERTIQETVEKISASQSDSEQALVQRLEDVRESYERTLRLFSDELAQKLRLVLDRQKPVIRELYAPAEAQVPVLRSLFRDFTALMPKRELATILREIEERIEQTEVDLASARHQAETFISQVVQQYRHPVLDALGVHKDGRAFEADWKLITHLSERVDELRAQIDMYRPLVSTGLAAEIANHEFEQQYRLMRRVFSRPSVRVLVESNKDVRNLEILFNHLERRHKMLSPFFTRRQVDVRKIQLISVGNAMREIFETAIRTYGIEFENEIEEDFEITESQQILWPVLINLLNNSVYWLLDRTDRRILLHSDAGNRLLYVEDSGPGISPDKAEKVFELFYSTRPDGRGIGLNLVRELLASRNHTISVMIDDPAKRLPGAGFRIQFAADTRSNKG